MDRDLSPTGTGAPRALVVHAEDAERVPLPSGGGFGLLVDGGSTGGALGANRLDLAEGADGGLPHLHTRSTELFHVLTGTVEFLLDGTLTPVAAGGTVVVPPGMPHAFGAAPGSAARLFVVLTPGLDRFGYFRALGRVQHGLEPFASLLPEQDRYDVHFLDPEPWRAARNRS
ncbi:cupin domain-containing protein [Streptomyces uncialis]|uniref:cupin domain-containing protein n=1 Tax=Streptomyces uncialis TaxID=1048205 RepID=UPI00386CF451|nr:cupin domain-containing protein [Streptomyces uncialis]